MTEPASRRARTISTASASRSLRTAGSIEGHPHGGILGEVVTGAHPDLEPAGAQVVERRQLLSERDRVAQVVVEDQRAQPYPLGAHGRRRQHGKGRRLRSHVVTDLEDVEPGFLRQAGGANHLTDVGRRGLEAEAEGPHPDSTR